MRAWLFVGGGVVIVAAVAVAFWVGDEPAPDPAAQDAVSEAPAVSDGPEAPAEQDTADMAPTEDAAEDAAEPETETVAEGTADEPAEGSAPPAEVDQTAVAASPDAQPAEAEAAAPQGAGDQLAEPETPTAEPESDVATTETVPEQSAQTVEQPPAEAAPGAAETDGGPSVAESSEGHPDEAGETEAVADEALPESAAPVAEGAVDRPDEAVETETVVEEVVVVEEAPPPTVAPAAEPQPDATDATAATDIADQGTAISEETGEASEIAEAPETSDGSAAEPRSDAVGEQLADAPAVVSDETATAPVASPSAEASDTLEETEQVAALPPAEPSAAEQPASDGGDGTVAVDQSAPPPASDTVELDIGPEAPSFDAVRVNENGMIIVAGRAEPGATVVITDNGEPIGTVEADDLGEFVFIGRQPLSPGDHEIGLEAFMADDPETVTPSSRIVLLVVPEPGLTVADTAPAEDTTGEGDTGALAVLVDRDEVAPTEVLQTPQAPAVETAEAQAETEADPSVERPSAVDAVPANEQTPDTEAPVVSIDVVDYDDNGRLIVAGRAVAGAIIIIYLDNRPIGQAVAAADGRFWLRPDDPVAPGLYTLRADQVDDGGVVVARAETPFQRTAPLADIPDNRQIIVQPGNNLWRLARRIYGQGLQYTVIYQANRDQIRNPDLIYPGQVFELPSPPQQLPAGVPSRI
ncbi:MAG: LysM peptidoglycan-binding domain-containing protein [Pseudomonadota bacterium]